MNQAFKFGLGLFLTSTALSSGLYAQDWTGGYIGLEGGFTALNSITERYPGGPVYSEAELSGMLLGGEVGYNMQMSNNVVIGFAGDWAFSTVGGEGQWYSNVPFTLDLNSLATAQAKLGMAVGPSSQTLLYVGGGVAFGSVDLGGWPTDASARHIGYVVSVGAEHMINDAISIKADVSYVNLGTQDYNPGESVKLDGMMGSVGVNFHF
jgi:opacity protein-like surface antigen